MRRSEELGGDHIFIHIFSQRAVYLRNFPVKPVETKLSHQLHCVKYFRRFWVDGKQSE